MTLACPFAPGASACASSRKRYMFLIRHTILLDPTVLALALHVPHYIVPSM